MSHNGETDWRIRNTNHETVEQQRKDTGNALLSKGALLVVAVLAVAAKNYSGEIPEFLFDSAILVLLSFSLLVIAASALIIIWGLRQRRKRMAADETQTPYSDYAPNNAENHNYAEIIDSWDIKDPKPPWEL